MTTTIHATTVALSGHGVLLRGESGSGKSDLALRLLDDARGDVRLVADDYTDLSLRDGALWAAAPVTIAGLLEVRGLGVLRLPVERVQAEGARVRLCIDLVPSDTVERLPAPAAVTLLPDQVVPLVRLDPFAASAPAKVRLAVGLAVGDILPAP
ncbi:HPr kinase/phosphorylase [Caenispirillum bisanense]|uniref:Hpr(Ser) kinase/phosphatase n=1 Tax=Caenispirillum bisanense TaxID=414052 RepID=A0A286GU28_9PROT|nr:HPr kinase/phosphatase C-terminal domain-containing protein [Caenispirillum bisanense]SOD99018.1 Hpr(Ser) kinase/phosphatase [Caenispirillum bisanense]